MSAWLLSWKLWPWCPQEKQLYGNFGQGENVWNQSKLENMDKGGCLKSGGNWNIGHGRCLKWGKNWNFGHGGCLKLVKNWIFLDGGWLKTGQKLKFWWWRMPENKSKL